MTADDVAAAWATVERAVAETARFPPGALSFDPEQVIVEKRADGWLVATGVLACDRAMAWLSITDDAPPERVEALTEVRLAGRWSDSPKRLYQRLDLPWPFQDRHYILRLETNARLAPSGVWERAWTVDNVGIEPADALLVTRNEGSWLLADMGRWTLGVYQVRADMGGSVPDEAVRAYAASSTEELFAKTEANCASVAQRCVPGLRGGDGEAIDCPG